MSFVFLNLDLFNQQMFRLISEKNVVCNPHNLGTLHDLPPIAIWLIRRRK